MTPIEMPPRLSLAQLPTPLQHLSRLSSAVGTNIWVKRDDLTGTLLTGNKVRKLEFTLAEAQRQGANALVTCGGIQSNHCRATAAAGAQLGLKVKLVLRGECPPVADGNLFLDQLLGAEIDCYPAEIYRPTLKQLLQQSAEDLANRGFTPFIIPTGASDGIGLWGYVNAIEELRADCQSVGINPSHIVSATGSGGTQAGLSLGVHLSGWHTRVVGFAVCDDERYFQRKVRADLRDWQRRYAHQIAWVSEVDLDDVMVAVDDRFIGPGYAEANAEVFATIAHVAQMEGLVLDPIYTGKAFHGMLESLKRGEWGDARDVVFVHTGGIFGTFSQRSGFELTPQGD